MSQPAPAASGPAPAVSRRSFGAGLAAGAAGVGAVTALAGEGDEAGGPREPAVAPRPPVPADLFARAELLFEALLGEFPQTRLEARRTEVTRDIAVNLYYGGLLRSAGLTNADGPGPLWSAYRAAE